MINFLLTQHLYAYIILQDITYSSSVQPKSPEKRRKNIAGKNTIIKFIQKMTLSVAYVDGKIVKSNMVTQLQ